MTEDPNDELIERLSDLRGADVSERARERIRREAKRAFRREASLAGRPVLRRLRRAYDRAIEPALLVALSFGYVAWAVMEVQSILHP